MCLTLGTRAFAFGHEGHEAVAILALQKLQADKSANNPKAKAALQNINTILGNDDLAAVAVWADWVRLKETNHLSLAVIHDIKARFPGSDDWHFVNLPLGTPNYSDDAVSANDDDVVHGINKCIGMLESADTSAEKDHHAVALKFLVHLAGDIHQPLHVACGYYRWGQKVIVRDPAVVSINKLPHDRGGNHLLLPAGNSSGELHQMWDSELVFMQVGHHSSVPATQIAQVLGNAMVPNLFPAQTGDHHDWAANWATDTTKAAVLAYKGIRVSKVPLPKPHQSKAQIAKVPLVGFDEEKYAKYLNANEPVERQQLLKASWRLAELLENINWHN